MPSHQDRVSNNYDGLCVRCLKRPISWDDDGRGYTYLCDYCWWNKHFTDDPNARVPLHMIKYVNLDDYILDDKTSPKFPMYVKKPKDSSLSQKKLEDQQ